MSLKIQLLGRYRITRDGQPIELPGYRPLALLTYLLLTRKAHRREHLIDLLFDGPDDPRASLRWTLSKLRKALGSEYILADREEISFNFQSEFWLDVTAYEAGDSEVYQGDLLEGLSLRNAYRFEEWLLFERQRLRGQYQANLEQQLELHLRQGDAAAIVITAQQLLKLDYLREDWHFALLEAYARLGKPVAALEQYELCRQMLRKEWGLDPSPQLTARAAEIRAGRSETGTKAAEGGPGLRSKPGEPYGALMAIEQAKEPASLVERDSRPGHPWLVSMLVGVIISLIGGLLVWGRLTGRNGQVVLAGTGNPSPTGSAVAQAPAAREFAGTTVWILGPFYDTKAKLFEQSMAPLEERTGIDVVFLSGGKPYEEYLAAKLETGDLPDIVVFPQPSWLAHLEGQGKIVDIRTFLDEAYLRQQYPQVFLDLATVDGKLLGIWYTVYLKSLIWYPKQAFDKKGYKVPETWDELIALSDQIVADGGTPWCIGIYEYGAQGWAGTDWVEDILLRTAPPEAYDAWVRHDVLFNSPEIRRVFEIMGQIWLNDDYVYGGRDHINQESFFDSPKHLFEDPPGCYLHKQATFIPFFFPAGVRYGEDYDFFYLPPIDAEHGKPVLGSGELLAMFNDRPEVREVMRYLTTPEATRSLIEYGNFFSPNRNIPLEWFSSPADLKFAQIILGADTYRFDGSDLMPGEVGFGSFYRGITDWVEGTDLEAVLQEIDDSWPR